MDFSVVETLTYKRCRRKWILSSENGASLTSIRHVPALALGSLMHETLEAWTKAPTDIDPQRTFLKQARKLMDKADESYTAKVGAPMSESEKGPLLDVVDLGYQMVKNYAEEYNNKPFSDQWEWLEMEQRAIVEVPGTEHWECDSCHLLYEGDSNAAGQVMHWPCICGGQIQWVRHRIRGTFDGLLRNKRTGRYFVLERKTWAMHPKPEKLEVEEQMRTYHWMLRELFPNEAGGILYDGMWKRDGTNPKHKGKLFYRQLFKRTTQDLNECGEQLAPILTEMAELVWLARTQGMNHPRLYHNRRWEGCHDCMMDRLCATISRGEDIDYVTATFYTKRDDPNLNYDAERVAEEGDGA